jgi:demethylmenaquinone methyltransferase/2-methoxy-6-polyprenyl-1,4-benzoquinol methylase
MDNPFYEPGEGRAAKVNALFGAVARRYDLLNDLQSFSLHRRWKQRVVQLAGARAGLRALDLCCGTGDLALAMARGGAEVIGLDFNTAMLAVARKRKQRAEARSGKAADDGVNAASGQRPSTRVRFVRADAQRIPFPDATFDVISVGYGLRNLADWETGLREMARVAKPGARLLVLEFGKPANPVWRFVYFSYLRLFVPLLGLLFCGNASAYAYILESLRHYPAQAGVAVGMRDLGLSDVRIVNLLGGAMSINYGLKK